MRTTLLLPYTVEVPDGEPSTEYVFEVSVLLEQERGAWVLGDYEVRRLLSVCLYYRKQGAEFEPADSIEDSECWQRLAPKLVEWFERKLDASAALQSELVRLAVEREGASV